MINFICSFGFVGILFLILSIGDIFFTGFLYLIYKLDHGKLGMVEYFKRMI